MQKYGAVLFDEPDNPELGGWSSVAGAKSRRINAPGDLAMDVIWLTNLNWSQFRKTGLAAYPHLRLDSFMKITPVQVLGDFGYNTTYRIKNEDGVSLVAEVFDRVCAIVKREFDVEVRGFATLKDEISAVVKPSTEFVNNDFHEICKRAHQSYSLCPTKPDKNARAVQVRRNRVAHALDVCTTPVPTSDFRLVKGPYISSSNNRVEVLCASEVPVLANISVKSISNDMMDIVAFGSTPSPNRRQAMVRDWVTQTELMMLSRCADITVHAAYMGSGWEDLKTRVTLDPTPMDYMSSSYGIVAENFRLAHSTDVAGKGGPGYMTAQAVWMAAADRFYSFLLAAKLAAKGFTVSGYGSGAVNLMVYPSSFNDLMKTAYDMELNFPLWLQRATYEAEILDSAMEEEE